MEIGSEFWKQKKDFIADNETLFLSGRTALNAIIQDALLEYGINSVLLPSYCCHTMIDPFLRNNVSVRFYDIFVNSEGKLCADIPKACDNEMLYIMKYFGDIGITYTRCGANINDWKVSIEDTTHSCFYKNYESSADYIFASYRKWFAVDGVAVVRKKYGKLITPQKVAFEKYCDLRNKAYYMKERYMAGENVNKQEFLAIFKDAEDLLNEDYSDYGVRLNSIISLFLFKEKLDSIREIRRRNAHILLNGISDIKEMIPFVDFSDKNTCPLFVPVLVDNEKRDELRGYLIKNEIYCPVHWPISEMHTGISDRAKKIYGEEISLICDQRYGQEEMKRIVNVIREFFDRI